MLQAIQNNKQNIIYIQVKDNHNGFIKEYGGVTNYGVAIPLQDWTIMHLLDAHKDGYITILDYKKV